MSPNAHSTLKETHTFTRFHRQHLPTTVKMVEEAILALNSRRGFSLHKLKKYICDKYQLELNPQRNNLIRNHLRAQLANDMLINVTGKGLTGSMRVAAKGKKSSSNTIATEMQQSREGNGSRDVTFVAAKRKKALGKTKSANKSTSGSQERTPPNIIVQPILIPDAPQRNSMTGHGHLEAGGTPCSSGGRVGRKRKLLPPALEYIALSQEY